MGMRFRKSIKIAPGVKVNLGKKSAGISVGNKYGGISYNTRTGTRTRVSAPGTGLYYSEKIGGGSRRAFSATASSAGPSDSASLSTPDDLREAANKLRSNLKLVQIFYPILFVLLIIMGFSVGPFCFIIAVVLALYAISYRKKAHTQIPDLMQRADQLDLVQDELHTIEEAERALSSTKNAAIFFLNYDRIIDASISVVEKAPSISQYTSAENCQSAISEALNSEIDQLLKYDFEKTYKHLYELKTQKGIDSAISKFKAPYEPNLQKLNDRQVQIYQSNVKKLESVTLPDT